MIEEYDHKYANRVNYLGSFLKSPYNVKNLGEFEKILVYTKEDEVVGFIQYRKLYETVEVLYLVVDEKYRRLGIASELIEHVGRDLDVQKLILEVRVSNEGAIDFYQNNGFKKIRPIKNYYMDGEDAISMEKVIRDE